MKDDLRDALIVWATDVLVRVIDRLAAEAKPRGDYDAAMKRAMEAASDVARERRMEGWTAPKGGGYSATPQRGHKPPPPKGPGCVSPERGD